MIKFLFLILVISILINLGGAVWIFKNSIQPNMLEKTSGISTNASVKGLSKIDVIETGEPMGVEQLPDKIDSWNLYTENWEVFFKDGNKYRKLFYDNREVGFAKLSPSHTKLGFFFYPEGQFLKEVVLVILDINQQVVTEIYRGNLWTSNWEWKGDEAIIVKRSCGTECMTAYVIDVSKGEKVDEYRVY